jgi:hypothetical protein
MINLKVIIYIKRLGVDNASNKNSSDGEHVPDFKLDGNFFPIEV